MMTKLKCLFGKLLKPLFIISLISCFTLLGNSFVNAQDFRLGLTTPVQGNNWSGAYFSLQDNGNFLTNGSYKYFINNPSYDYYVSLSWIDRKLYVIVSDGNLNVQNQGFVNCFGLDDYDDDPNGYYGGGCGYQDNISLTPDEFYGSGTFRNPDGFKVTGILYSESVYCFIYSDINKQVCFIADPDSYNQLNLFTGSLGFTSNPKPEDFAGSQLASRVGNSPFSTGSSSNFVPGPSVEFKPCMTLREILALRPEYTQDLCYSSSSIFSGNSFVSITPKSIFELFPTFSDFNSAMDSFYNYCGNSVVLQNQCSLAFEGKQAEFSLVSKIPHGDIRRQDLYNYCDRVLNYDLNISSCVASGGFSELNPRTDIGGDDFVNGILFPSNPNIPGITSGSALDYLWGVYHSGDFTDFISDPSVLEKVGDDVFNIFPTGGIRDDFLGILPKYIIVGFLGILILYFIRR